MKIKKILQIGIIISLIISLFLVPFYISSPAENNIKTTHVVINEVCYNTTDKGAWWFELYNPTNTPVNLSGWHMGVACIECLFDLPTTSIQPGEYIVICAIKENFTRYWSVPDGTQVFEFKSWCHYEDICKDAPISIEGDGIGDIVGVNNYYGGRLPPLPLNHSWARYRSGYDTNNFTNDFYDEPYPTPGYENHWEKPKLGIIHSPNSRNVTLHWNYTVNPDIRKYNLLISSLPSFPQNATNTIEILDTNISSYEFTNLSDGRYYFKLLVYNSTGSYAESNVVTIPQPPSPPLNLTATLFDSKVKLTWEPPLSDGNAPITEYKIYRGTSESSLEVMASVNGSVNEYIDDDVTKGEKYYYAVSAVNPLGEGNMSEIVSIEIPKEKEPVPSIGFAGMIGGIAIVMYIKYRRKREK